MLHPYAWFLLCTKNGTHEKCQPICIQAQVLLLNHPVRPISVKKVYDGDELIGLKFTQMFFVRQWQSPAQILELHFQTSNRNLPVDMPSGPCLCFWQNLAVDMRYFHPRATHYSADDFEAESQCSKQHSSLPTATWDSDDNLSPRCRRYRCDGDSRHTVMILWCI